MLLAIDVGNTQTVLGLFEGDALKAHWRIATDHQTTYDELRIKLDALLAIEHLDESAIGGMAVASVVPSLTKLWEVVSLKVCGQPPVLAGIATVPWLEVAYENPAEIGADRLADTVAAIDAHGAPVIVVDLGTATNIEVIDAEGRFAGGIICPGFVTSTNALFDAAARIPRFDIVEPPGVIGKTTRDAVRSGLLYGEVDRIDGLVRRVLAELGRPAPVVGTGGLVTTIARHSQTITDVDRDLTLKGLRIIYERNAQASGA